MKRVRRDVEVFFTDRSRYLEIDGVPHEILEDGRVVEIKEEESDGVDKG